MPAILETTPPDYSETKEKLDSDRHEDQWANSVALVRALGLARSGTGRGMGTAGREIIQWRRLPSNGTDPWRNAFRPGLLGRPLSRRYPRYAGPSLGVEVACRNEGRRASPPATTRPLIRDLAPRFPPERCLPLTDR